MALLDLFEDLGVIAGVLVGGAIVEEPLKKKLAPVSAKVDAAINRPSDKPGWFARSKAKLEEKHPELVVTQSGAKKGS